MISRLRTWLQLPLFQDEDQNRIATQLNGFLLVALFTLSVTIAFRIIQDLPFWSVEGIVIITFVLVTIGGLIALRKGRIYLTSVLILTITWLMLSFLPWMRGGVYDTALISYIMVILAAALFMKGRAVAIFTILSVLNIWLLSYGEQSGLTTPQLPQPNNSVTQAVDLSTSFIAIAFLTYLLVNGLNQALTAARQSNHQLHTLSSNLENQVIERTQSAQQAQAQAEAARQAIEEQMWFTTGQALLSEQLRGEQNIETLANHIMQHLCSYLNVPVGALFIRQDNEYLNLIGRHAYVLPPEHPTQFKVGEGLVGAAAPTITSHHHNRHTPRTARHCLWFASKSTNLSVVSTLPARR